MEAIERISNWIKDYFATNGKVSNAVIGISGGKDSTVAAALLAHAIGPDRITAVKMPQNIQPDIHYANDVIDFLRINTVYEVNIGPACQATLDSLPPGMADIPAVYINVPARERMKVLYAIAAATHGRVVNTSNESEKYVGYTTKFGDSAGDFALLANYTVREVLMIGEQLKIPERLLWKTPEDGLSGKTDEANLGFPYRVLDAFLMDNIYPDIDTYSNITNLARASRHKNQPMPVCPNYFRHSAHVF